MKHALTWVVALATTGTAWAHQGHGLPGASHWHASDASGLVMAVVAVVVAAAAIWWRNRN